MNIVVGLENKALILFDGICNLCNNGVDFILKRDKDDYFRFASIQSELGKNIIKRLNSKMEDLESIILLENDNAFYKSTAALKIAKRLSGFWKLFYIFIVIPPFIRDFLYDIIADYRYKLFGKKDTCRIPSPAERSKFLS